MIPVLTAAEMRALEHAAIESGRVSSLELQERAAEGALALLPDGEPVHVLAGPGNNGGDALALARLARLLGRSVEVWTLHPQPSWKGDAAVQAERWEAAGGGFRFTETPCEVVEGFQGWVVDGLFGLSGRVPLEGLAAQWGGALNRCSVAGSFWEQCPFKVLALDLPSGFAPDSGESNSIDAIAATRTACFGYRKVCHALLPNRAYCGDLAVVQLPGLEEPEPGLWLAEAPQQRYWGFDTHKRDFGHVGIRAGRIGMSGAAVLAALGALRMGAGLVTLLVDAEVRAEIAAQVPEAMVRVWTGVVPADLDVLLVGPGGVDEIPAWDGALVLDASALRAGEGPCWMARPGTVLTPHPGEFARLFNVTKPEGSDGRLEAMRSAAKGPATLVLKGAQTLIGGGDDPSLLINPSGHRGLSTGGTGDFLAGMVAAAVGQALAGGGPDRPPEEMRRIVGEAVWLHGAAADRLGPGPLMVRELGPSLAGLLRELHKDWDGDWRPLSER